MKRDDLHDLVLLIALLAALAALVVVTIATGAAAAVDVGLRELAIFLGGALAGVAVTGAGRRPPPRA